ncbi:MAG: hypothetical protein AAGD25_17615 [Cyanobacteria bacterium P01_F01_bin.150]
MGITYLNRREKTYYLHQSKTKTGKPKYFFSSKDEGELADFIPDGYEIYESPNSQVFLRKIPKKIITDEEVAIAEKGMRKFCQVSPFIVDVKKDILSIFTPSQSASALADVTMNSKLLRDKSRADAEAYWNRMVDYHSDMRFILVDKQDRLFQLQRYCYRGSVDDWINIDAPDKLEPLIAKYVKHIGQESMFELYPWH